MEEASELDFRHDMTPEELVVSDVWHPGKHMVADGSLTYTSQPNTCASVNASSDSELSVVNDVYDDIPQYDEYVDISDASSLSSDFPDDCDLSDQLSNWALKFNICKEAITALLHILHRYHPGLPLDARTLLNTPDVSNYQIKLITGGSYYHFGVSHGLKKLFNDGIVVSSASCDTRLLQLQVNVVNVDGLPIYKSTNFQLWPILGMLVGVRGKVPFVIGLFGGHKSLAIFLNTLVILWMNVVH